MTPEHSIPDNLPALSPSAAEQLQQAHYAEIATAYEAHYDDACSLQYRDLFFHAPMFAGLDLAGKQVLEAMCGNGAAAGYLLRQGASVTGLDLSPQAIAGFQARWPGCAALCGSLAASGLPGESFDCIAIVGGLHHLHPHLNEAVHELWRLLKPGGALCFAEPHAGSLPDVIRQWWYRHDPLFASNEAAIDLADMHRALAGKFAFTRESYGGNVAYVFVLNSMVTRLPLWLKPYYTPALNWLEARLQRWQGRRNSCFVIGQWHKL